MNTPPVQLGLLGCGAMGRFLAAQVATVPGWSIAAWWDPDMEACRRFAQDFPTFADAARVPSAWTPGLLTHLIEAAHPSAVSEALQIATQLHCTAIIASVGGLIAPGAERALQEAQAAGVRVLVPSGAIGGLDLLRAIPRDALQSVTLRTRKPPSALPPPEAKNITAATRLFAGTAREAIGRFPKNVNVAVTLSLAGIGPDRTHVEVWADPAVERNTHDIEIVSSIGSYQISCANVPLAENPGTSAIAAWSILGLLRGDAPGLRVGT